MSTILLVDDDNLVLGLLGRGLRSAGYTTVEADDPRAACDLAEQHEPDLAVLDMRMPGMSGLELARRLQEKRPTPFLFLTAFSDEEIVRESVALGALGYMVKPLSVTQFVPMVTAALAQVAKQREFETALHSNRTISRAVGVLMERHDLTEADAFACLRRCARALRGKLIDVAAAFVADEPRIVQRLQAEIAASATLSRRTP